MRIYRFEAKMADLMNVSTIGGRMAPPSATSATDAALGLRPRRALSSAQLSAEWTTSNPLRNDSSLNSFYPLNFVSHNMGAVHLGIPPPVRKRSADGTIALMLLKTLPPGSVHSEPLGVNHFTRTD